MVKKVVVDLEEELDAEVIAELVRVANQFTSSIHIKVDENCTVNVKSIMGMMNFYVEDGQEVIIKAQGEDDEEAVEAVADCLTGKE